MGAPAGAGTQYDESIYFITPPNEKSKEQYKILPVVMAVLLDQDHVQDFLVELENSPMAIQVMDFELQRPTSRVTKPEKGTQPGGFGMMGEMGGYGGMMMGNMMMRRMAEGGMGGGMTGYGGMMSQMMGQQMMQMRGMMEGYGGMMGSNQQAQRKGTDVRSVNREKKREETKKAVEAAKGPSLFDPYYDIVEVTVYGQARFFNSPPEEPKPEPSPGETAAQPEASAPAATGSPAPSTPTAQAAPAPPGAGTGPDAATTGAEAAKPAEATAPAAKSEAPPNQTKSAVPKE
jgi:hypothetical protein